MFEVFLIRTHNDVMSLIHTQRFLLDTMLSRTEPDMAMIFMLIGFLTVISLAEVCMSMIMTRFIRDRFGSTVLMMLGNMVQRKSLRIKDGVTSTTPAGLVGVCSIYLPYAW